MICSIFFNVYAVEIGERVKHADITEFSISINYFLFRKSNLFRSYFDDGFIGREKGPELMAAEIPRLVKYVVQPCPTIL